MKERNYEYYLNGPSWCRKRDTSGKLVKEFGLTQISTGDLFRKAHREQTSIGVISDYFSSLVDLFLMTSLMKWFMTILKKT